MAALNAIARAEADTIREGIAWLIVWKTGRSWHAESVYLSVEDDTFEPEDLHWVNAVLEEDPNAVMVNGYYCGHLGEDMTVEEIEAGLRWHYENGCSRLEGSTAFPILDTFRKTSDGTDAESGKTRTDSFVTNSTNQQYQPTVPTNSTNQPAEESAAAPAEIITREPFATIEIVKKELDGLIDMFYNALAKLFETARKVLGSLAERMIATMSDYMDALLYSANDRPQWWHLYKNAKKARTRKKYRRLLMRQLLSRLSAPAV